MCHTEVAEQYRASVHGQALARGVTQAPLCTDCHGEHNIIKHTNDASPVNAAHIRDTCGSCHGDVRLTRKFGMPSRPPGELRFFLSRPGRQGRLADRSQLRELPRRTQYSAVFGSQSPPSIPRTCPRLAANAIPAPAPVSPSARCTSPRAAASRRRLRWVRQFYLLLIPVTIGLMLLHNGGDWLRKLIRLRFQPRAAAVRSGRPAATARPRRTADAALRACAARACWCFRSSPWRGPASR